MSILELFQELTMIRYLPMLFEHQVSLIHRNHIFDSYCHLLEAFVIVNYGTQSNDVKNVYVNYVLITPYILRVVDETSVLLTIMR